MQKNMNAEFEGVVGKKDKEDKKHQSSRKDDTEVDNQIEQNQSVVKNNEKERKKIKQLEIDTNQVDLNIHDIDLELDGVSQQNVHRNGNESEAAVLDAQKYNARAK